MKGRAARTNGECRKSFLAAIGSAFADSRSLLVDSVAETVLVRAASAACLMEPEVDILVVGFGRESEVEEIEGEGEGEGEVEVEVEVEEK
jgi:hypothetical protein